MEGIGVAASIIGIAEAGFQIATKLITLATQIKTASDRVSSIGNDISLTSGVLRQLGELMDQIGISIFNEDGLELTRKSAATCDRIFLEVKNEAMKASKQIRESKWPTGSKLKLSNAEKAKWPFLQPSIEILRGDLREAKGTLMLMLQLGNLALCKRMADIKQEASIDKTEQRDFMLAIRALLQDQKVARGGVLHGPTKEIPRETSGQEISNTAKSSLGSDADKSDPPATIRINTQNKAPLNPPPSESKRQIQDLESSASIAAVQSPGPPRGTTNYRRDQPREHVPNFQAQPRERVVRPNPTEPKLKIGMHLFLLKPVVENFFDKIELTWLLQNIHMRESAIDRYLDEQEYQRNDVFDMLHTLHPYETKILDGVIFGIDMRTEGSLLSLKRTKTTICHRDITFTDVPGLQFVVSREPQSSDEVTMIVPPPRRMQYRREHLHQRARSRSSRRPPILSYDATYPIRQDIARERAGMYDHGGGAPSQRRHDDVVDVMERPSARGGRSPSRAPIGTAFELVGSDEDRYPQARHERHAITSSSSEDEGHSVAKAELEPVSLPEQDEDAVIDDMLKRYTTVFD